jgi:DNA-binding transcriptional LysR family regulator
VRLQDLLHADWMLPGRAWRTARVEARLAEAGMPPPRVAVEVNNTAGQLSRLVANSDLVSIISEAMLSGPAGEGLVPRPFAEARFPRAIGVVVRRGHVLPPLARRFVEILRESARS